MMKKNISEQIEIYAKGIMPQTGVHDFEHVNRVRRLALAIAAKEGYKDREAVEAASLLHDIGYYLTSTEKNHGQTGSAAAAEYLKENGFFTGGQVREIAHAIEHHCSNRGGEGKLLDILRDADMIEGFGAIGILRCIIFKAQTPFYDPSYVKGETWGLKAVDFDKRIDSGVGVGGFLVDHMNFQISWYDNLATETARQFVKPRVQFLKDYLIQLERETDQWRSI